MLAGRRGKPIEIRAKHVFEHEHRNKNHRRDHAGPRSDLLAFQGAMRYSSAKARCGITVSVGRCQWTFTSRFGAVRLENQIALVQTAHPPREQQAEESLELNRQRGTAPPI